MNALPQTPRLLAVARRVVWFQEPAEALSEPLRFLAYAMTYGTIADLNSLAEAVGPADLREALTHAPPGIFDPRSWAYWHLRLNQAPAPPLPVRDGLLRT